MKILSLLFISLLLFSCTDLFYYPDHIFRREIKDWQGAAEEILLQEKGEPDLVGWRIFARSKEARALILFFHGNAQNISTHVTLVDWLTEYGFDIALFDYRGYGRSEGVANIQGIHEDVARMITWAEQEAQKRNQALVLYGQSIGASMLPWALKKEGMSDICATILESPFYSYQSIALEKLRQGGILAYILSPGIFLIRNDYSPKYFLPDIEKEILFVISEDDQVISTKQTETLAALAPNKKLWKVGGANHVGAFQSVTWRRSLVGYLEKKCLG